MDIEQNTYAGFREREMQMGKSLGIFAGLCVYQ